MGLRSRAGGSPFTVSALMAWLSERLAIWLPTLADLAQWPVFAHLWGYLVPSGPPSGDPPWTIDVEGKLPLNDYFTLDGIQVLVGHRLPPDVHPSTPESSHADLPSP